MKRLIFVLILVCVFACSSAPKSDSSYLVDAFAGTEPKEISLSYDFEYKENGNYDAKSKFTYLSALDLSDSENMLKQIEKILKGKTFEEVSREEVHGLELCMAFNNGNNTLLAFYPEGYLETTRQGTLEGVVYKVDKGLVSKLYSLVEEATSKLK